MLFPAATSAPCKKKLALAPAKISALVNLQLTMFKLYIFIYIYIIIIYIYIYRRFNAIVSQLKMHYFSGGAFESLISSQLLKKEKYI